MCVCAPTHIRPHLPKHVVPVVPDTVEAQDLAVHLHEPLELVVVRRGAVGILGQLSADTVGVSRRVLLWVELDAFTGHELLGDGRGARWGRGEGEEMGSEEEKEGGGGFNAKGGDEK